MPRAAVFWPIRDLAVEDDFLRPRVVGILEGRGCKKLRGETQRDASPLVSILRPLFFDVTQAETDRVKGDQLPDPLPVGILRALAAEPAREAPASPGRFLEQLARHAETEVQLFGIVHVVDAREPQFAGIENAKERLLLGVVKQGVLGRSGFVRLRHAEVARALKSIHGRGNLLGQLRRVGPGGRGGQTSSAWCGVRRHGGRRRIGGMVRQSSLCPFGMAAAAEAFLEDPGAGVATRVLRLGTNSMGTQCRRAVCSRAFSDQPGRPKQNGKMQKEVLNTSCTLFATR